MCVSTVCTYVCMYVCTYACIVHNNICMHTYVVRTYRGTCNLMCVYVTYIHTYIHTYREFSEYVTLCVGDIKASSYGI